MFFSGLVQIYHGVKIVKNYNASHQHDCLYSRHWIFQFLLKCRGGSRISEKGVHMYKDADLISLFLNIPLR